MIQTKKQSKVSISGLTYNNLIEDAYNALKDSNAFKNNFNSFTSNSAERMITELYAYVATQLANRMDQMGNELFVDTASIAGLSRLLKLVGARVAFPAAAETEVLVTTPSKSNAITFSPGINGDNGNTLYFNSDSFKSVNANNGTSWEFIERKVGEDGEYVYDYTSKFEFTPTSQKYTLYEGVSHSVIYRVNSINTDIITLNSTPVLRNSVRIYYRDKVLKGGTTDTYEISELKKVDNFFTTEALTADVGVFTERNVGGGRCEICIKPFYDEATNESDIGKELLIMYRTGSGEEGNISPGAINTTERFATVGAEGRVTGYGQLNITNTTAGNGGVNELTTDQIRATVLQEVRNTKIAVTEEDYEYLFPLYDSKIALVKCYGEKDDETADLSETYGYYVNPLYIWLLILKSNTELSELYKENGSSILTDVINDIQLSTFDINPRFDEKYQINRASLNLLFKKDTLKDRLTESTNTYSFPVDEQGVDILKSGACEITITTSPYIESSQVEKKGVGCFNRYTNEDVEGRTWAQLLALDGATKDDVYIITDSDYYDEVNNRWRCKRTYTGTLTEETVLTYWGKVDFEYIYDNFVPDSSTLIDKLYIEGSGTEDSVTFSSLYSKILNSFNLSWENFENSQYWTDDSLNFPAGTYLTINGTQMDLSQKIGGFASAEELCEFINDKLYPTTNMVILKESVSTIDDGNPRTIEITGSREGYTVGTPAIILKDHDGNIQTIDVTVTNVTNYGQLVDALNGAIGSAGLSSTYKAILFQAANNCYNLAIISAQSFTYNDRSTDGPSAIYKYLLNGNAELPLKSSTYAIEEDPTQEPWGAGFYDAKTELAYVNENGNICFRFDDEGRCSVNVVGNSDIKVLFGLDTNIDKEGKTVIDRRTAIVALNVGTDSSSAFINVTTTSNTDRLDSDIYINIFGKDGGLIKLGSYYEKENIEKIYENQAIRNLLTRDPIKNLYSTNYIATGSESNLDKYGSNYQLKFSTGPAGELTFNQLSSESSPAYVTTTTTSNYSMVSHNAGDYLYVKIDNIDFTSPGLVYIESRPSEPIEVEEYNGYAKYDLTDFNSWTVFEFAETIVNTFKTSGVESSPLLKDRMTENGNMVIYTTSSAYYSSIDFGNTNQTILYSLFGLNEAVVHSSEGQINAEQIKYKYFSIRNVAAGRNMVIRVTKNNNVYQDTVNIGYSIVDFQNNISKAEHIKNYVTLDNNRIILKELENDTSITINLSWDSKIQHSSFESMFSAETWKDFIITIDGDGEKTWAELMALESADVDDKYLITDEDPNRNKNSWWKCKTAISGGPINPNDYATYWELTDETGSATCTYENDGDYYINLVSDNKGNNIYYFVVQNPAAYPYGDVYFHMYEDYSNDHIVSIDEDEKVIYTDEYNWNRLMTEKRVMLTEHVYKQPRFIPFDLAITVYLPNNQQNSNIDYTDEISQLLLEEYGPYADTIGVEIVPEDIIFKIKESFSQVRRVTVDYLGYDMTNQTTNKSSLETKFNQKHIIASTIASLQMVADPITGLLSQQLITTQGLKITLRYQA